MQYCQYCANAVPHGDSWCWCEERHKLISETSACKSNKCKHFELNEISVFEPSRIYKPRAQKTEDGKQEEWQIKEETK